MKGNYNGCTMNVYVKVPAYLTPEEFLKPYQQNKRKEELSPII